MSMDRQKTVAATTLGCKVNFYETEAMLEQFARQGYAVVDFAEVADIYIINTCTVTNLGDKKSRQMIRRANKQNPDAIVIAAGCYAQVAPEEVARIEGVNLIVGTKDRMSVVTLAESFAAAQEAQEEQSAAQKTIVTDVMHEHVFEPLSVEGMQDRQRVYIKIQEGCDRFCAYCIIPYARGPVRSRPLADVVDEIQRLAANGYKEIVLSGIHVASYGKDLENMNLLRALAAAHEVAGVERIRMSSVEPTVVTEEFVRAVAEMPKMCDHFHLSLQSGCDRTLKRMNRRYTAAEYCRAAETLRKYMPNVALTTDVIAGFPGETEEDFAESYAFIEALGLTRLHVFPYSAKKGTPAAGFADQIPKAVKDARVKRLMALSERMHKEFLQSFVGREMPVLFEQVTQNGYCEGHTTNYIQVSAKADACAVNQIVTVRMETMDNEIMQGILC